MALSLKQISRAGYLSALSLFALAIANDPNDAKASDCALDGYTGSVCWTAASYCPPKFKPANGLVMSIPENPALYSLIGDQFGGDGRTNFALPDLRGRTIAGTGTDGDLSSYVARGQRYGAEGTILTPENLPPHAHEWKLGTAQLTGTLKGTNVEGNSPSPGNRSLAARPSTGLIAKKMPIYGTSTTTHLNQNAVILEANPAENRTEKTGLSAPIPVRPKQLTFLACIMTDGLYPVPPQ